MPSTRLPGRRLNLGILAVTCLVTILYWVIWFFGNRSWLATTNTSEYLTFENAFPLADGWMALTAGLGFVALWKGKPTALLWVLLCGSASLYLAGMDILFDLENGIYSLKGGDVGGVVAEVVINLFSLVCGGVMIRFAWTRRHALLAGEPPTVST